MNIYINVVIYTIEICIGIYIEFLFVRSINFVTTGAKNDSFPRNKQYNSTMMIPSQIINASSVGSMNPYGRD